MSFFSDRLVAWQRSSGRHGLPWQNTRDPYRVWLSEIMLQQTQVKTVLGYYARFLEVFPSVDALAHASVDEVMPLWSGLGYYSRARNLHRAAQMVVAQFNGQFPSDPDLLVQLPGVGRSTAHAIAAFCFGVQRSIFDANVQRVMARYLGFEEDLASASAIKTLWAKAEALVPKQDGVNAMPAYTQGLMDLGATVCTSKRAHCGACPVAGDCQARLKQLTHVLPRKTRKLKRSSSTWYWLVLCRDQHHQCDSQSSIALPQLALHKRPDKGIWAQLYAFPTFEDEAALLLAWQNLGGQAGGLDWQPGFRHVLTHKDLNLVPVVAQLPSQAAPSVQMVGHGDMPLGHLEWVDVDQLIQGRWALPAPLLAWLKHSTFADTDKMC
ncbi:A/G-specific adenine glycosylase [Lampropedia puyangensis]|uniref:Adenine DNA glycosylase n=1 Tax=Lampropedia puyangensis TaxID=1330072 RepID=A0A4S8EW59_9BURK|nr:A/G-specific adenine glycosylase [Lampropedia puyangensis]THT98728.1 A/G-specific adenine glycosylase [Lampropedia puyangensis]